MSAATFPASLINSANDLRLGNRRLRPAILSLRKLIKLPPMSLHGFFRRLRALLRSDLRKWLDSDDRRSRGRGQSMVQSSSAALRRKTSVCRNCIYRDFSFRLRNPPQGKRKSGWQWHDDGTCAWQSIMAHREAEDTLHAYVALNEPEDWIDSIDFSDLPERHRRPPR